MTPLKIGDRVKILSSTRFHPNRAGIGQTGEVRRLDTKEMVIVDCADGAQRKYMRSDLAPIPAAPEVAGGAPCAYCYGTGHKRLTAAEFVPCGVCGGSGSVPEVTGGGEEFDQLAMERDLAAHRDRPGRELRELERHPVPMSMRSPPVPVAAAAPGDDEAALVSLIAVEIYGGSELTDDEAGTLAVRIVRLTQERFTLTKRSAT